MLIIGLTGSIATGKSTVSSILSSPPHSIPIIDADLIARQVVEPGKPAYKAIVNYFGPTTPDLLIQQGTENNNDNNNNGNPLNRPALGRRVFGDTPERKRDRMVLNKIVHPAVRKEVYKSLIKNYIKGSWAVILDVPLLFESGLDLICGSVVVVSVSDSKVQMERLLNRDPHLSVEDAFNRVQSQGDVKGKAVRTEFRNSNLFGFGGNYGGGSNSRGVVVNNDGGKGELEVDVARAIKILSRSSPSWWAWLLLFVPPLGVGAALWNLVLNFRLQKAWERQERETKAKL